MLRHPIDGRRLEQLGAVLPGGVHADLALADPQQQVELRPSLLVRDLGAADALAARTSVARPATRGCGRRSSPGRPASGSGRARDSWPARPSRRAHRRSAKASSVVSRARDEQLGEGRVAGQVHTKRERIDEVADHRLELCPVAPRERRPDHDVVLPGVARQQRREQRQHRDEQASRRCRARRRADPRAPRMSSIMLRWSPR